MAATVLIEVCATVLGTMTANCQRGGAKPSENYEAGSAGGKTIFRLAGSSGIGAFWKRAVRSRSAPRMQSRADTATPLPCKVKRLACRSGESADAIGGLAQFAQLATTIWRGTLFPYGPCVTAVMERAPGKCSERNESIKDPER